MNNFTQMFISDSSKYGNIMMHHSHFFNGQGRKRDDKPFNFVSNTSIFM